MTVGKYLEQLGDDDAARVAARLERAVFDCPLTSPVGEHCKKIIDATIAYVTVIEETSPLFGEAEFRWEVWWHACATMQIVYFG